MADGGELEQDMIPVEVAGEEQPSSPSARSRARKPKVDREEPKFRTADYLQEGHKMLSLDVLMVDTELEHGQVLLPSLFCLLSVMHQRK
jgi:hypothetical protein